MFQVMKYIHLDEGITYIILTCKVFLTLILRKGFKSWILQFLQSWKTNSESYELEEISLKLSGTENMSRL